MPFSFFSDKNMLEKILRKNSFMLQMGCLSLLVHLQQLHDSPASLLNLCLLVCFQIKIFKSKSWRKIPCYDWDVSLDYCNYGSCMTHLPPLPVDITGSLPTDSAQSIPEHLNLNLTPKLKMFGVSFVSIPPHMFITSSLLFWQQNISYLCENPDTSKESAFSILFVLLLSHSCDAKFSKPVLA